MEVCLEFIAAAESGIACRGTDCGTTAVLWNWGNSFEKWSKSPYQGTHLFLSLHGNILTNSSQRKVTEELFMYCLYQKSQSCWRIWVICGDFFQTKKPRLHLQRSWLSTCFYKALQVILMHGQGWGPLKCRVKFQWRTRLWVTSKSNINGNLLYLLNGFKIACLKRVKLFCGKVPIMLWFIH